MKKRALNVQTRDVDMVAVDNFPVSWYRRNRCWDAGKYTRISGKRKSLDTHIHNNYNSAIADKL